MLLRIIDKGDSKGINIEFTSRKKCESYEVVEFESPFSRNFLTQLDWYFSDYAIGSADINGDKSVNGRLITQSQYFGDAIIGEDHELIRLKECIEDSGYENLDVRIESQNHDFFSELWETLILPDSKYILSTVVSEFSRTFCTRDKQSLPEIEFGLNVTPPVSKQISQILDKSSSRSEQEKKHAPLNILYLVSRDIDNTGKETNADGIGDEESCAFNLALDHVNTEGAIDIEVWPIECWEYVVNRLKDTGNPVHIVHFDGPVLLEGEQAFLVSHSQTGGNEKLSVSAFTKLLVEAKTALFTLDAREYINKEVAVSHSNGLAVVAGIAGKAGLGNVVGLSHKTPVWQSFDCFKSLYQQIAGGHPLNRAVVEARKSLQSRTETTFTNIRKLPFQKWPLLVHYGYQNVTFFKEPQACLSPEESQVIQISREKLFGFQAAMLPPQFQNISDHGLLSALASIKLHSHLASQKIITLLGDSGAGKTQLSHTLSFYLASKKLINFGFRFDFERDSLSISDIKEMIAPVLQTDSGSVLGALENQRCCFVLDGLVASTLDDLKPLVDELLSQGHIVIGCIRELVPQVMEQPITIKPLTARERCILALRVLENRNIEADPEDENWISDFYTVLDKTAGNPLLIKNLVALLTSHSPNELNELVTKNVMQNDQTSLVLQFYRWQWSQTHDFWKIILLLASQTNNLLIEMIMVAWEGDGNTHFGDRLKEAIQKIQPVYSPLDLKVSISDHIKLWHTQGYIQATINGHAVDPYFISKISDSISKEDPLSKVLVSDEVKLTFSQLVCEGLARLSSHLLRQQDQQLFQYIISNRRAWIEHFERLWESQDYKGFISVKNVFDQILTQAKIGGESAVWSLDLSNRTEFDLDDPQNSVVARLAWLTLATTGLTSQALDAVGLEQGFSNVCNKVVQVQAWVNKNSFDDQESAALFSKACFFLEAFYLKTKNWKQLIVLGESVCPVFLEKEVWLSAIKLLKSMSVSYIKLNQPEDAIACEEKLIHEVSYDGSPPGYKSQVLFEIVLSRIARKDYQSAQKTLDLMKRSEGAKNIAELIQGVQSEIFYETGEYKLALPYYSKLWVRASQANDQRQASHIKECLAVIKEQIGEEDFGQIFTSATPPGTASPESYELSGSI
ncbi:hypothetical protein Q4519_11755 [Motilimonas sp. 1_MG-2023]|uniref:hypothetical protein n=1 Tax=Motilimonas sp. 1_MG-2023 TaxID=3062672 RepID=UPI0026E156FD|nr:hypothetical protein [Motilimonas sp. 1_MG-2023]MDO6526358.1 hypothetical protein [Motilimonas sp. 1_MG-2023]